MNQWLSALLGLGVGSVIVALINGYFSKRKLSAEATKIITGAAAEVVEIQKAELARIVASNTLLNGRADGLQIQLDEVKSVLRAQAAALEVHAFWDLQAVGIAREHGIDLPPPPPLTTGS